MAAAKKTTDKKPVAEEAAATDTYTVEACGVTVDIRSDITEDWEVMEALMASQDETSDEVARGTATVALVRALFGTEYGRVKRELRAANSGRLTPQIMVEFVTDVFNQVAALKN